MLLTGRTAVPGWDDRCVIAPLRERRLNVIVRLVTTGSSAFQCEALERVDQLRCLPARQVRVGLLQRGFGVECGEGRNAKPRAKLVEGGVGCRALLHERNDL